MAGMGIKKVLQATPVGYLAEMEDGSQVTFPEHVMVDAGLVEPTQGMYGAQDPGATPSYADAAYSGAPAAPQQQMPQMPPAPVQAAPAPAPQPISPTPPLGSSSEGMRTSDSGQMLVRRTDVRGAPPPVDFRAERAGMAAAEGEVTGGFGDARVAVGQRQQAVAGQAGVDEKYANEGAEHNRDFAEMRAQVDGVVREAVETKSAALSERVAKVPQEDPSHYWSSENALANASGLLASALGGMLAVSTGSGRNLGLEALERAIDRDIQAQRTNIENEWKGIAQDEKSLQGYKDWQAQTRTWDSEQRALMFETLALEKEAESVKFSSASKQAELMGQAAELRVKSAEHQQQYIKDVASMSKLEADSALDRWYKTEQLSLDKLNSSSTRSLQRAQADAAARSGKGDVKDPNQLVRLGNLPMTGEEIYVPADILQTMGDGEAKELTKVAAKVSTNTRKSQELVGIMRDVGRVYSGPGAHRRPATKAKVEQLRAAWRDLQFDEVVSRTGLTATDAATQKILEILNGTGELPSWTVGSGDMAAFGDYVTRNVERDADLLESRGLILQRTAGEGEKGEDGAAIPAGAVIRRRAGALGKDARKYADAAGKALKEVETLGRDPIEVANSALTKLGSGDSDAVVDGLYMLSGVHARNSQGMLENPDLASSVADFATRADSSGKVVKGIDAEGRTELNPRSTNADLLTIVRANGARALAREKDGKKRAAIKDALQEVEQALRKQDPVQQQGGPKSTNYRQFPDLAYPED